MTPATSRASLLISQQGGYVSVYIGAQLTRRAEIVGGPHRVRRQVHLGSLDVFVFDRGQQVGQHVQAGVLLAIGFHHVPRTNRDVGVHHHLVLSARVVLPPEDRLQVHRRELPLPNRIAAPGPEPSQLLLVGYREPVLAQDDAVVDEHLFEDGRLPQEPRMLLRRTESHHLLDTPPVVPGPVEQDDLTPRRQVRHIALVVPLPALPLGGCRQRGYPRDARAQILGDALDGPTLARGVATFEDDHDPGPGFPGPFLEPHEFRLKVEQFGSVDGFGDRSRGLLTRILPTLTHRRIVVRARLSGRLAAVLSDSRSMLGGTSRSLIASRSALTPRYNMP